MQSKRVVWSTLLAGAAACGGDDGNVQPVVPANIEEVTGNEQSGVVGAALPESLRVKVTDAAGNPAPGVSVTWSVLDGGGTVSPASSRTNGSGIASAEFSLGQSAGDQHAQADATGLAGSPVVFTAHGFTEPLIPALLEPSSGDAQSAAPGAPLPDSLSVRVTDAAGTSVPGVTVTWSVLSGGGAVSPTASTTNSSGVASTQFTLGPEVGEQQAQAEVTGLAGSPQIFTATAIAQTKGVVLSVAAGGNNVPERYTSDLWVHGSYAYTGTWGFRSQQGNVLKIWSLDASGAPSLAGSVPVSNIATVSDVQVSEDGQLLVLSGEGGGELGEDGGIFTYSLADPAHPALLATSLVPFGGVHTVTLSSIGGTLYAFAAKNPGFSGTPSENQPGLLIYSLAVPTSPVVVHREPIPPNYGIHDTFVRDGLAFVFAWDEGVIIYDVGNGINGGSPSAPVAVSRLVTAAS